MPPSSETERLKQAYSRRFRTPSDKYHISNPPQLYLLQKVEVQFLGKLKSSFNIDRWHDLQILDVGCGNGFWLQRFLSWGFSEGNLHGIELLHNRYESALKRLPNSDIQLGDASTLVFDDESMDVVFQCTVFTSILDSDTRKAVAKEMLRVLKPDGLLLWYDFRYNNPSNKDVKGISKAEVRELFNEMVFSGRSLIPLPPILYQLRSRFLILLLDGVSWICRWLRSHLFLTGRKRT